MQYPNKLAPICQPSESGVPTRDLPFTTYIDHIRAKYESEVYPVDRFAEVFHIEENVWALRLAAPTMIGANWAYLIEGPEKALLIDTGYGVGNHKGLCEQLVPGKEILCALSHFHLDHSGGAHQWEKVYCHEFTADVMEYELSQGRGNFQYYMGSTKMPIRRFFEDADVIPNTPYTLVPLKNHETINLGGDYDIELIHVAGHAPGLSCFLDKKGRRLYTADSCFESLMPGLGVGLDLRAKEYIPHAEYLDVNYLYEQLKGLAERSDEYDLTADGHGSIDSDKRVVSDLVEALEAVMADPFAYTQKVDGWFGTSYIMQRGIANCRYSDPATVLELPQKVEK